ncbi:MAG: 4Fe-4S binding protein [Clostridiales bacterium]|nr:4Fe-4S binding protein [Clostridiales bacterium]
MVVFLGSAIAGLFFGRFYCGWICPMNTVMRFETWLKRKLHIKSLATPNWLKQSWVRIAILIAFLGLAALGIIGQKPLPVLPALFFLGIGLTLFFPELLWHRYLCPYGTILSLPGRLSRKKMAIEASACVNCGACAKVCPTATISKSEAANTRSSLLNAWFAATVSRPASSTPFSTAEPAHFPADWTKGLAITPQVLMNPRQKVASSLAPTQLICTI